MTMRRNALALVAILASAVAVDAAPAPTGPPNNDAVTGVLRRVAYSDRELVVVGPGPMGKEMETTVAVPEAARIVKDGKDATLDDLKEGETASVQIEQKDGRPSAVAIQVGPGAAPEKRMTRAIPRIRRLLKVADQILQGLENRDKDR
jgi:hypothetical protein